MFGCSSCSYSGTVNRKISPAGDDIYFTTIYGSVYRTAGNSDPVLSTQCITFCFAFSRNIRTVLNGKCIRRVYSGSVIFFPRHINNWCLCFTCYPNDNISRPHTIINRMDCQCPASANGDCTIVAINTIPSRCDGIFPYQPYG